MSVEGSAEKTAALSELVKRTQSYNKNLTKVGLVMAKTRSDDLRWLRDYLQTQQVKAPICRELHQLTVHCQN
ncbi:hypothetical protein PDIG_20770 [Penicillium digitatum PHI26]|uniref:Uncharacterized protein n=2 Tax=Penicillium digitatum TaxID=36651 RepID=K9GP13_PEND2|nr:hypothetical protein PDIP_23080 [Penicillium digitatum Pd1]EKV16428.1 hypothetical protein PDIG_20770 [Penicillium digitatum PHI26]EKV19528.1 hypothetical protein PDIP_23080 [Penicillium digitatum Pd1]